MINKKEVFENELGYIRDSEVKEFTEKVVESLPDYFFEVAASSTGKYHPSYALGEGGLVRHTQAAVRIAVELFTIHQDISAADQDLIISALILHDGMKSGEIQSQYSKFDHPVIVANHILSKFGESLPEDKLGKILSCIKSHMGQWNMSKFSSVTLPVPSDVLQKFVHMCDYLASRKCLDFNFDAYVQRR